MIMPIADDNSDRLTTPFVTYGLIAANIFVFVVLQGMGENVGFTYSYSTVPKEIVTGRDIVTDGRNVQDPQTGAVFPMPGLGVTPISVYLTLLTSMFMHGSLMHLAGNMLYLWIFGDNIEDDLGHLRYLTFYVLTGLIASLAHVLTNASGANAEIPSLGASGAISGVLGGYMILHPGRSVHVLVLRMVTTVPAFMAIGLWFVFQVIEGLGAFGSSTGGGVAYAAHFGGFVAGLALVKLFDRPNRIERPRRRSGFDWLTLRERRERFPR